MAILMDLFVVADIDGWSAAHAIQIHLKVETLWIFDRDEDQIRLIETGQVSWSVDFK